MTVPDLQPPPHLPPKQEDINIILLLQNRLVPSMEGQKRGQSQLKGTGACMPDSAVRHNRHGNISLQAPVPEALSSLSGTSLSCGPGEAVPKPLVWFFSHPGGQKNYTCLL